LRTACVMDFAAVGSGWSFVKYPAEMKCVSGAEPSTPRNSSSASSPSGDRYAPSQSIVNATTIRPFTFAGGLAREQPQTTKAARYAQILAGM
jgi:hypothetical protein